MELFGITDIGKVRRQNQDVFETYLDEAGRFAIALVCDGMGGAKAGNVASALAAETFMKYLNERLDDMAGLSSAADRIAEAANAANRAVYEKSVSDYNCAGMGTTLTALVSTNEGEAVANIGDSRAYHITRSLVKQITTDHTVVEDMVARGDITRAQARRHPKRNLITRALGTVPDEDPDIFFLTLKSGEHILLCSDGLSNIVMESEVLYELQKSDGVRESSMKLLDMALSRGAPDNVTAVLFKK
ncbi:MAG: Stp1/IreP family PP2C-type Ser/Thr phosphatase [Oscillospiraceae bacterium]|jgi:protein phosphatase|nr:Stp1/IreP family PP2C-type Ser/Thr phosphatase [Oscillospiraceae bacterium]